MNNYLYGGFQVIGQYTTDSQHIKRRFVYAAGIDEPICMIVESDHQGWYGLNEFSTIASSWLCETQDPCYDEKAEYIVDDIIDLGDLSIFLSSSYYLEERPLLENAKYYGYVFDGKGNVVAMTYRNDPNQTGNPNETPYFVETYTYSPFGEVTIYNATAQQLTQSAIDNPYMFTAREYDPESGLYYYRLRMYSPTIGRFMQTDPIGYYDSMNLYQYCGNNPINFIDPMGLYKWPTPPPGAEGSRKNPIKINHADLVEAYRKLRESAAFPTGALGKVEVFRFAIADTPYYLNSGHYYSYEGKKYTGEEVNYIGVGGAAGYHGLSDSLVDIWNGGKAKPGEKFFWQIGKQLEREYQQKHPKPWYQPYFDRYIGSYLF